MEIVLRLSRIANIAELSIDRQIIVHLETGVRKRIGILEL